MHFKFAVVILAAGQSSRMGQPKMLLAWGGTSILGHLVAQWQALQASQIGVVCAANDPVVSAELNRIGRSGHDRIFNPAPERGMFSSIQCAAQWQGWEEGLTHWVLALGDQPHLREDTLRKLLEFSEAHHEVICQPTRAGHPRHPVILPKAIFKQLAASIAPHLKDLMAPLPRATCELDDPGLELDIDRPEDYEAAKRICAIT